MSRDLVAVERSPIDRWASHRDTDHFFEQGAKNVTQQRVAAYQAATSMQLTTGLYAHAMHQGDMLSREAYELYQAGGRSQQGQEVFETFTRELFSQYTQHVKAELEIAARTVTEIASRSIPDRQKRRWGR